MLEADQFPLTVTVPICAAPVGLAYRITVRLDHLDPEQSKAA